VVRLHHIQLTFQLFLLLQMVMVALLVLFQLHQLQGVVEQIEHNLKNIQEHLVDLGEELLVTDQVEQEILHQ